MKNISTTFVKYKNRYYPFTVTDLGDGQSIEISVPDFNFKTSYIKEDLPLFLAEFEDILDTALSLRQDTQKKKTFFRFRLTGEEKKQIEANAAKAGYNNVSTFVRDRSLMAA